LSTFFGSVHNDDKLGLFVLGNRLCGRFGLCGGSVTWLMAKMYGGAAIVLGLVAGYFAIRKDAVKDDRKDAKIEDLENAQDIHRRASDATSDERLRKYDDAGWRD
jgi:hypothetical protein